MNPFCYDTRHLLLPFRYKTRRDPFVSRLRSIPNERWAVLCSVLLQVSKKWLPLQCGGSFNPPPMRRNAPAQRPSSKLPGLLFSPFTIHPELSVPTCAPTCAYYRNLSELIRAIGRYQSGATTQPLQSFIRTCSTFYTYLSDKSLKRFIQIL